MPEDVTEGFAEEVDRRMERNKRMKVYEDLDFQRCVDVVLDTTDMYKDINYQRMSDPELQEFIEQTTTLQHHVQATLLAMKYIQGTRDERRWSWRTATQDMRYRK